MSGLNQPQRSFFVLSVLVLYLLLPALAFSQQQTYTVTIEKESLEQALGKLRAVSGASIAFNKEEIRNREVKAAVYRSKTIDQILTALLAHLPFTTERKGETWLIKKTVIVTTSTAADKTATGSISGSVVDEENGAPVQGATVLIGARTVVTDLEGNFSAQLAQGSYELVVSAIGYGSKQVTDLVIKSNQRFPVSVTLKREKGQLSGVTVRSSAKRESVAALYIRQKNAAGLTDGISAEQITRTPDKNVGEVLKRVSGVATVDNKYVVVRGLSERYNGAMLNGQLMPSTELNRKQFSFDIIPSNMVDHVTVYKTITPDISAEFGGGLVEVNTRSIPVENFTTITAGSTVNDHTTGKNFLSLQSSGSEYAGKAAAHRELFGRLDWKDQQSIIDYFNTHGKDPSLFNNNWGLYQRNAPASQNYQFALGRVRTLQQDRHLGVMLSATYRNTFQTQEINMTRDGFSGFDNEHGAFEGSRYGFTTNLGGLAAVGYTTRRNKLTYQALYIQNLDEQLILGKGGHTDNGYQLGYYDLVTQTALWQHQLKGEHALGKKGVKLNWGGNYTWLNRLKPDNHNMRANLSTDKTVPSNDFNIGGNINSGVGGGALRWWSRALEKNLGWNTDLAVPVAFKLGKTSFNNILKAGYAGWYKDRSFYVVNVVFDSSKTADYPTLSDAFDAAHRKSTVISRFGDGFKKQAALHAGYLMLDTRIAGKLRIVGGVRAEYYNLNNVNVVLDSLFSEINRTRGGNKNYDYSGLKSREPNWHFFPSVSLTYSLTPAMNLRLAYSKSIIRPDLREMSYFKEYDFELGGTYSSNKPLRSTILHHYDLRYEWYSQAGEVLSLSLFYKKMNYPMEIYQMASQREFDLRNNYSARNKGLELEFRKSFEFTGVPVLKHLTAYGNYTMLQGDVTRMEVNYGALDPNNALKITPIEIIGKTEKRLQTGASNYMYNAGLYYTEKPLSVSFSYNYVTNRMYRPTEQYPQSLFERPLQLLDAQVGVKLLQQKAEIKATISNLLNSTSIVYQNRYNGQAFPNPGANPDVYDEPSRKQLLYQAGEDYLDYQARPGRNYSISFTYNF
jgi:hypothetical protein